jgi:hypothetical protein
MEVKRQLCTDVYGKNLIKIVIFHTLFLHFRCSFKESHERAQKRTADVQSHLPVTGTEIDVHLFCHAWVTSQIQTILTSAVYLSRDVVGRNPQNFRKRI